MHPGMLLSCVLGLWNNPTNSLRSSEEDLVVYVLELPVIASYGKALF